MLCCAAYILVARKGMFQFSERGESSSIIKRNYLVNQSFKQIQWKL